MVNNFIEIVSNKSDEELLVMVYEFDQWSPEMLDAVEAELMKRNILPTDIKSKKQELIKEEDIVLSNGKEATLIGQVFGWIGISGLLGLFIGYNYAYSKVRSKYTQKEYFKYNEASRKTGGYIFYTAIVIWTLFIIYKMLQFGLINA